MILLDKFSSRDITLAEIDSISYCEVTEERQCRVELVELLLLEREQEGLEAWTWRPGGLDLEAWTWSCLIGYVLTDFLITFLSLSSNNVF